MNRRHVTALGLLGALGQLGSAAAAGPPETRAVRIAVGGRAFLQYAPLTLAERLGNFKAAGLDVEILDVGSGSKSLQALVGGSTDLTAGSFDHLVQMQAKHQDILGVVLFSRFPGIVVGLRPDKAKGYRGAQDLKGLKIGVTAPGSQTSFVVNYMLAQAGLKPSDVTFVGVGSGASAVAAVRQGVIDGLANADPAITTLELAGELTAIADTRTAAGNEQLFGTGYPSGTIYTTAAFAKANPDTVQAVTTAMVRTLVWLRTASLEAIVQTLPPEWSAGEGKTFLEAVRRSRPIFSEDGRFSRAGAEIAAKVLSRFDPAVGAAAIDPEAGYTNRFVDAALAAVGAAR